MANGRPVGSSCGATETVPAAVTHSQGTEGGGRNGKAGRCSNVGREAGAGVGRCHGNGAYPAFRLQSNVAVGLAGVERPWSISRCCTRREV